MRTAAAPLPSTTISLRPSGEMVKIAPRTSSGVRASQSSSAVSAGEAGPPASGVASASQVAIDSCDQAVIVPVSSRSANSAPVRGDTTSRTGPSRVIVATGSASERIVDLR
jgi:hypothetical protein